MSARIAFSWIGLPQYAARLIRAAIRKLDEPCVVIGSRPEVPVEGMERVLGQPVHWLDSNRPASWSALGLSPPKLFVQSGWSYPAFRSLGKEAKAAGAKIVGTSDANWRKDWRQLVLGPAAFRLMHRGHFDAFLTPGKEGMRLLRYFGMPRDRIRSGLLGADPELFTPGPPLAQRPKTILFVGQYIKRKDVVRLAEVFLALKARHPDWSLHICGSGPLADAIPRDQAIRIEPFVQPDELVALFKQARLLALPSLVEAWGLVVHEAVLSGCGMILSSAIGSAADLATPRNSFLHAPGDSASLIQALDAAMSSGDAWLADAEAESLRLATKFGPARFASEMVLLRDELLPGPVGLR